MFSPAIVSYLAMLQYGSSKSSGSDAAVMTFIVFVVLALIAVAAFTVGAIIYSARKRSDRTTQLNAVAQQIGFSFSPKPGVPDFLKNTRFAQWYPAVGTGIHNLLAGNVSGTTVFIFDFGYTRTAGGFGSATYQETVACIPRNDGEPFTFHSDCTLVAPGQIRVFLEAALSAFAGTSRREPPVSLAS